jgi:hypothetical protein
MEITKREIIASISIIAIMLLIGLWFDGKIADWNTDQNEKYAKAVKIEDSDMFQYGMETNVGTAFVYGELKAVDTVTYPEIGGEYMYVEKVREQYTMHTRTYTTTDSKGNTQTHTETYWTWDRVESESVGCDEISFCGIVFPSNKIRFPSAEYIDTLKESSTIRYKYYGVNTLYTGTIFTSLCDGTITDGSSFYNEYNISETVQMLKDANVISQILFWVFWIILIIAIIYGFYYMDNWWLNDA